MKAKNKSFRNYLFKSEDPKGTWELNAMWNPGLDSKPEKSKNKIVGKWGNSSETCKLAKLV